MRAPRASAVATVVVLLAAVISAAPSEASTPRAGRPCGKRGVVRTYHSKRFVCVRSGKKLVWRVKVTPKPTPKPVDPGVFQLASLTSAAKRALADSNRAIPTVDPASPVTIDQVGSQSLPNFVRADQPNKFSYIGPTPLLETNSDQTGGVSLRTHDGRMVYGSVAALPPWGAAFSLQTSDPQGRFIVETSFYGNNGPGNWRLAYKSATSSWRLQSVQGVTHPTDGAKHFDQVSLGAPGIYLIQLEFQWNTTFYGIGTVDATSSIATLNAADRVKVMIIGDSWTMPVITDTVPYQQWDGYPLALTWLSGWNVLAAGVGGQGYLAVAAGETYRNRVVRDVVPQSPDVVIFTGSPNDHCQTCTFTDHEIGAEVAADLKLIKQSYPHALVILCSPFQGWPNLAIEFKAAATSAGVPYIDFIGLPLFTRTNNGEGQLANGHPTLAGSAYIAAQLLRSIAALQ